MERVTVYVVMGNDYPDAVFTSEQVAKAYVLKKKAHRDLHRVTRIHWRYYEFTLNREATQ